MIKIKSFKTPNFFSSVFLILALCFIFISSFDFSYAVVYTYGNPATDCANKGQISPDFCDYAYYYSSGDYIKMKCHDTGFLCAPKSNPDSYYTITNKAKPGTIEYDIGTTKKEYGWSDTYPDASCSGNSGNFACISCKTGWGRKDANECYEYKPSSSGCHATAHPSDSSGICCEATSSGYEWFDLNNACCGDDGSADDFSSHTNSLTSSTSATCYRCYNGVDQNSSSLVGNGHISGTGTSRTCYYGDMTCTYSEASHGASATIYGWGWYSGSLTTSTTVSCRSGAGTCRDGSYGSDSITTLHGNGYFTGSDLTKSTSGTCFYGDMSCSSGVESSGSRKTIYGNGFLSGSGTSRTCYYGDMTCSNGAAADGSSTTIYGWGWYSGSLTTSTTVSCRSGAGSCSDGSASSDSISYLRGNGYLSGSGTSRTCYYGDITCRYGSESHGSSSTIYGWGWYSGDLETSTSVSCRSGAGSCSDGSASSDSVSTLYGNGYLSGSGTSRTCYYGDISCTDGSESHGSSSTIYGWGWHSGDLDTSTIVSCRSGAGSCSDGSASSDSASTLYGNGYFTGSDLTKSTSGTCYYGNITCSSGTESHGTSKSIYGNGYLSGSGTSRTCYYGDMTCSEDSASSGSSSTVYGWGWYSRSLTADTSVQCRSGAGTCSDGSASSDTISTLYGNGYKSGTTCYYGDMSCSSGSEAHGASCTLTNSDDACVPDTGCLNGPTSLTASILPSNLNSDMSVVRLSWTDNSDIEEGFTVERSIDGSSWVEIGLPSAGTTEFIDSNLRDNMVYRYRVKSRKGSYSSAYSNVFEIQTPDRVGPKGFYPETTLSANPSQNSISVDSVLLEVASAGSNDDPRSRYIKVNGVTKVTTPRSYSACKFTENWNFVTCNTYDVYGSTSERDSLVSFLNSFNQGEYVVVATYDEPSNNLNSDLKNELISFGATYDRLNSIEYRGSYLLIGKKGVSEGEAIAEKVGPRYGSSIYEKHVATPYRMSSTTSNPEPSFGFFEEFYELNSDDFNVGLGVSLSSDRLKIDGPGSRSWGSHYYVSKEKFSRSDGMVFEVNSKGIGTRGDYMVGIFDSGSGKSYSDMVYAIFAYPGRSRFTIYEDGTSRGTSFGPVVSADKEYNFKIVVKESGGAKYYINGELVRDTSYSTEDNLRAGVTVAAQSQVFDNMLLSDTYGDSSFEDTKASDVAKPSEVSSLTSSSHSTFSWSNDKTVDFSWNGASDSGSTYYFYTRVFDLEGNSNNILENGQFERDLDSNGYPDYWSKPSYASRSADAFEGSYSLHVGYNSGSWAGISQTKSYGEYEKGQGYILTFRYKCSSGNARYFLGDNVNYGKWSTGGSKACTGNWETFSRYFYLDGDQPSNGVLSVYLYGHYSSSNDLVYDDVRLYPADSETITTGVDGYDISCDTNSGELSTTSKNIETLTSHTCTFSDGSSNYFHIKSVDNAGNWDDTSADIGPFYIDTVKPLSSIASPLQSTWFNSDFSVSVTDSDDRSGLKTCHYKTYSYDGSSWILTKTNTRSCDSAFTVTVGDSKDCRIAGQDTCKVEVYSEDNAGNVAVVDSRTFNVAWCPTLSGKEFIVQTPVTKCFEFDETGYGKLKGSFEENCNSPAPEGSYVVKNSLGNTAFWIDSSCDMCIRGNLFFNYNVLLSGANDFYIKKDSGNYLMKADPQTGDLYVRNHFGFSCNMG